MSFLTKQPKCETGSIVSAAAFSFATACSAVWAIRHLMAPAVRAWRPGGGKIKRAGNLAVRILGSNRERATVLLHGLVASGDTFGSAFDGFGARGFLVVPDLLGFGRSMDAQRSRFSLEDHLTALDDMLNVLGISESRLTIAGHSLGALIALHWAARRSAQVTALTLWSAPLYRNAREAHVRLKQMGILEALFAHDTNLARISCQLMCAVRPLARALAVAISPDLPVPISSKAVSHTWPAYRDGMEILYSDWWQPLRQLEKTRIPITLMAGARDPAQVPDRARELASEYSSLREITVPGATHILPITHGAFCARELARDESEPHFADKLPHK